MKKIMSYIAVFTLCLLLMGCSAEAKIEESSSQIEKNFDVALMDKLDEWCFAAERQAGDPTNIRSDYGYHILYITGITEIWYTEAEDGLLSQLEAD